MKRCPSCNRTYTDPSLNFCLEDGTPLVAGGAVDPNATIRYTGPLETNPPETGGYRQQTPLLNQVDATAQPRQWSATAAAAPAQEIERCLVGRGRRAGGRNNRYRRRNYGVGAREYGLQRQ